MAIRRTLLHSTSSVRVKIRLGPRWGRSRRSPDTLLEQDTHLHLHVYTTLDVGGVLFMATEATKEQKYQKQKHEKTGGKDH